MITAQPPFLCLNTLSIVVADALASQTALASSGVRPHSASTRLRRATGQRSSTYLAKASLVCRVSGIEG